MNTFRIAIDIGNTRTKFAQFNAMGEVEQLLIWESAELETSLALWINQQNPEDKLMIGWTSTSRPFNLSGLDCWDHFSLKPDFFPIQSVADVPLQTSYQTPATLGIDRIVGVYAACNVSRGKAVMLIDMGTAITYDFADKQGVYRGGGISPGVAMRFKALNHFTARLPLVQPTQVPPLLGDSTDSCILSGVMNGVMAEVQGIIQRYKSEFGPDIQLFLTGGDAAFFENHLKNINFADSNLILKGIYYILTHKSPL